MQFDGAIAIVLIIAVVGAFIAFVIVDEVARTTRGLITGTIVLWLVGYGITTIIVIVASTFFHKPITPQNEPLAHTYVAEQMGFVSGETYPLQLGGRIGGSDGESTTTTTTTTGLFSARSTTTMQGSTTPASAVSFSYTNAEGKTYIVEIPTSRVTFIQSEAGDPKVDGPSVTMWLNEGASYDFGEKIYTEYSAQECEWTFNNILLMCLWPDYNEPGPTPTVTQHAFDVGLGPVIQAGFDRATIVLPKDMHNQLLGIIE